tara:strand:+ start:5531 stop:5977 length:447 start_codon:yes stop_codon:yes gene_type:complete
LRIKLDGTNPKELETYMKNQEVFSLFAPELDSNSWNLEITRNSFWLGFYIEEKLKGVMLVEQRPNAYLMLHPYMLKKDREYKFKMIKLFEKWAKKNTNSGKIVGEFPSFYENLSTFSEKCGYTFMCTNTKSYRLGNVFYDSLMYGKEI